jgi:hypothetical protein
MSFNITSGVVAKAQKVVLYGVEGIGKSTFAAQFPNPVFIDTEGSTENMDVKRMPKPLSWQMLLDEVADVKQKQEYQTLVLDTADWAETLAVQAVLARSGNTSIEDFCYGKGYVMITEEFGKLLNLLSELTDVGINVVVTAHSEIRKFEKPDEMGAFDRYQLKLSKKVAPLLKEWGGMVLFANYKTTIVTDTKTNSKKDTGGKRVMYTTHHPAWDAKNRHNLADELPFEYGQIAHIFNVEAQVASQQTVASVVETQPEQTELLPIQQVTTAQTAPNFEREPIVIDPAIDSQLAQLMSANSVTEDEVKAVVVEKGFMPASVPIRDYPPELVQGGLVAQWDAIYSQITAKRAY